MSRISSRYAVDGSSKMLHGLTYEVRAGVLIRSSLVVDAETLELLRS